MGKIELMTRDIEKSFKGLSRLAVVSVVMSLAFATVVGVAALVYAEKQREKIYVLDRGKSLLLALQTDAVMSKEIEVKDHVTRFHELMFTLSPQKQTIQRIWIVHSTWPTGLHTNIRRIWLRRDTIRDLCLRTFLSR